MREKIRSGEHPSIDWLTLGALLNLKCVIHAYMRFCNTPCKIICTSMEKGTDFRMLSCASLVCTAVDQAYTKLI